MGEFACAFDAKTLGTESNTSFAIHDFVEIREYWFSYLSGMLRSNVLNIMGTKIPGDVVMAVSMIVSLCELN